MIIRDFAIFKGYSVRCRQRNNTNKDSNDNKIPTFMEAVTRLTFRMRWANENSDFLSISDEFQTLIGCKIAVNQ